MIICPLRKVFEEAVGVASHADEVLAAYPAHTQKIVQSSASKRNQLKMIFVFIYIPCAGVFSKWQISFAELLFSFSLLGSSFRRDSLKKGLTSSRTTTTWKSRKIWK